MLIIGQPSSYHEAKEMEFIARVFIVSKRINEIVSESKKKNENKKDVGMYRRFAFEKSNHNR